jgi:hypothetical protein
MTAMLQFQAAAVHWKAVFDQGEDPRQGPSDSLQLPTHGGWVHNLLPGTVHTRANSENSPAHLKLCMSGWLLWALVQYRLGGHHLNGHLHCIPRETACELCGFGHRFSQKWHARMEKRCGSDSANDLRHLPGHSMGYGMSIFGIHFQICLHTTMDIQWGHGYKLCSVVTTRASWPAVCSKMDMFEKGFLSNGITFGGMPRQQHLATLLPFAKAAGTRRVTLLTGRQECQDQHRACRAAGFGHCCSGHRK